ncbi:MAG TPA: hypothetical protein VN712_05100 [Dermatophilaceae bacterium]|nr:hypothetical protein [Dermatophilaceae bacterium]
MTTGYLIGSGICALGYIVFWIRSGTPFKWGDLGLLLLFALAWPVVVPYAVGFYRGYMA